MALEKLKDLLKNETDNLGFAEALFGVCGAVFLYLVDLTTKWNGYPLLEVFSGALLIDALRIVIFGFFTIRLLMLIVEHNKQGFHWSAYISEGLLHLLWIMTAAIALKNPTSTLHLLFSILIYFLFGKAVPEEHKEDFTRAILVLTFMDFYGYALLKGISIGFILENQFNRILVPLWGFYVIGFAMKHNSSAIFSWTFFIISAIYVAALFDGVSLMAQQTDNLDQGIINQAKSSVFRGLNLLFGIPQMITDGWNNFYQQTFNQSYIYGGEQEETKNPQGVYLTEIERGDYTNYADSPIYIWARLEARTLDKPINPVTVTCSAELDDGNITQGIVNEESTEYKFLVISGVDRTISCRFNNLTEGRYTAVFNATFDFATDARRKVYLMDRDRDIEELQALNQRGQQATGKDVLLQLEITDTAPETIYTSGPVLVGIGSDNVPWDIGDQNNIKYRFGVTAENEWTIGGEILKINKIEMIVPPTFDIITTSCDIKMQPAGSREGDKVYATTEVIDDIDNLKTINCLMNVDKRSLDPVPVTTRFLRAHVDYTYMITEEIDFEVEPLPGNTT